jgi:hypothetical protein
MGSIESKSSLRSSASRDIGGRGHHREWGAPEIDRNNIALRPRFALIRQIRAGFGPLFWPERSPSPKRHAPSLSLVGFSKRGDRSLQKALPFARLLAFLKRRRQQVTPLVLPICWGSIFSQGMALPSTKTTLVRSSARYSRWGLRPWGFWAAPLARAALRYFNARRFTYSLVISLTYPTTAVLKGSLRVGTTRLSPDEEDEVLRCS